MNDYAWTPDMGEISGFGGEYEEACRQMLRQGLQWCDAHPDAKPRYKGFENVYGLCIDDNEDAKQLDKALTADIPGGPTGAMHQAVVSHIFFIRANGWEAYCAKMRERSS